MNRRNQSKNRNALTHNRLLQSLIAVVLVLIAAAGIYFLTLSPETSPPTDNMLQTSFTERTYEEFTAEVEYAEAPADPPGTVTDLTEDDTEETEQPTEPEPKEEETVTETDENGGIEQPVEDLSLMIANAKNYVYTIYTDLEQGSGFLFNEKGDILTNAHVVKDAAYITVKNSNGQEFNGRVIGISETEDIALIRVPDIAGKQPMEMEMDPVETGTKVFALGSPENINNTSTEGEITSTGNSFVNDYQYNDLYEMTANIKQGSSGGPLISAKSGKILGINSIVLTDNPDIGFTIPIYTVMDQLKEWANNPVPAEEEVVIPDVKDAYFNEELLRSFLTDYYTLIPYSLNDEEVTYYQFFLLPESQAYQKGREIVEDLKSDTRVFEAVDPTITSLKINEEEAVIKVDATFTFHDNEEDRIVSIRHQLIYTIVIDAYGDYQISAINNQ